MQVFKSLPRQLIFFEGYSCVAVLLKHLFEIYMYMSASNLITRSTNKKPSVINPPTMALTLMRCYQWIPNGILMAHDLGGLQCEVAS